ncbi:MAG: C39 family peptidase [Candidatus Sericytochromatia bacterium]|nr:C39 family peptidase [Candidatus Sericytochromatia bacterium]
MNPWHLLMNLLGVLGSSPSSPPVPPPLVRHAVCGPSGAVLREGVWFSSPLKPGVAIQEAWPSWDVQAPPGTTVHLALRFREREDTPWSSWLTAGQWGDAAPVPTDEATSSEGLSVDIDTVLCSRPVTWAQWRVRVEQAPGAAEPKVGRLVLAALGSPLVGDSLEPDPLQPPSRPDWRGILQVPFKDQGTEVPRMKGSLCSPTTAWMALAAVGRAPESLEDFAWRIHDTRHDLFGVWPRATAATAERGLPGYVTRLSGRDQLRDHLAAGHLVGASIRYAEGQLRKPPDLPSTKGHLILLRGLRVDGAVISNDPATPGSGDGFAWLPEDLDSAWLGRDGGGMAYVFERAEALGAR